MEKKTLLVIDIQKDASKTYKTVIDNVNKVIAYAQKEAYSIIYIKHNELSPGARLFLPDTEGEKFAPELNVVSDHIFTKTKSNVLTSEEFVKFITDNDLHSFIIVGQDATICLKAATYNMCKAGYDITVIKDAISSWNMKKIPEMLEYYHKQGAKIMSVDELIK